MDWRGKGVLEEHTKYSGGLTTVPTSTAPILWRAPFFPAFDVLVPVLSSILRMLRTVNSSDYRYVSSEVRHSLCDAAKFAPSGGAILNDSSAYSGRSSQLSFCLWSLAVIPG
ncbi:uncharacterized protein UTRI_03314 [Ustilago trichophora]|uniref:Uncharacterized protein n=1 Tax=Ustilago trichophora TaxID=86804 RepID=A0A5C3E9R9_9BASI|nr:uncharacterized protein UTRI_03314 [Ustilago trichophora]